MPHTLHIACQTHEKYIQNTKFQYQCALEVKETEEKQIKPNQTDSSNLVVLEMTLYFSPLIDL